MTKKAIINKINAIIREFGDFTVTDVQAKSSPFLNTKGKLRHLGEEFMDGQCVVFVYNPMNYFFSEEIDKYDEFYESFDKSQLCYILELSENWAKIQKEEE